MTVETMRTKDWDVGKSKNIKDNADCVLDLADIGIPCFWQPQDKNFLSQVWNPRSRCR